MDAPELRKDLIVNRWVLISPRRGKRPHDYQKTNADMRLQSGLSPGPCSFCYNHENETGPELWSIMNEGCSPNEPCWRVRVVENKFPAVSLDLDDSDDSLCPSGEGILKACCLPGFGSHEVIIETPDHDRVYTFLSVEEISDILRAYQSRMESLRSDGRFKYCQIFKNNGKVAGASMVHPHSQIIALPVVPKAVEEEVSGSKAYYEKADKCVFCEMIKSDLGLSRTRLVDESPLFIAATPFAARFPYEIWILPRQHNSHFGLISEDEVKGLAELLKKVMTKLDLAFDYPPFNLMVQTAPLHDCVVPYYHWYIRIVPHLVSLAGFELASGCHINPVAPESAAELLRGIQLDNAAEKSFTGNDIRLNKTADSESPQRLIKMADLETPVRTISMADL